MSLFRVLFREARGGIIGWSIGIGLLALIAMASYPAIEGQDEFDELWEDLPESVRNLFGGTASLTSVEGYLDSQLLAYLPVLTGIFAVVHVSKAIAGAEEDGRLDVLLSTPVSRTRFMLNFTAVALLAQTLVIVATAGIVWMMAVALDVDAHKGEVLLACLNPLPAAYAFTAVAIAASAIGHRRSIPVAVGTIFIVATFFIGGLAPTLDGVDWLKYGSLTYHYAQSKPLSTGLDPLYFFLTSLVTVISIGIAVIAMDRKDLTG